LLEAKTSGKSTFLNLLLDIKINSYNAIPSGIDLVSGQLIQTRMIALLSIKITEVGSVDLSALLNSGEISDKYSCNWITENRFQLEERCCKLIEMETSNSNSQPTLRNSDCAVVVINGSSPITRGDTALIAEAIAREIPICLFVSN